MSNNICYLCANPSTHVNRNKVPFCDYCDNDFADDEPVTAPLFGEDEFLFTAENEMLNISDERFRLLDSLFSECRRVRERLLPTGPTYQIRTEELTDFFVILDAIESL